MSTKIYTAYKATRAQWWNLSARIAATARVRAAKTLKARTENLLALAQSNGDLAANIREKCRLGADYDVKNMGLFYAFDYLRRMYGAQYLNGQRSDVDFNVWLSIYPSHKSVLIIPGEGDGLRGTLDFLKRVKGLRFYGYWNNVDRPVGVSSQDWYHRRIEWENALEGHIPHVLHIVDVEHFYEFNPALSSQMWKLKGAS